MDVRYDNLYTWGLTLLHVGCGHVYMWRVVHGHPLDAAVRTAVREKKRGVPVHYKGQLMIGPLILYIWSTLI